MGGLAVDAEEPELRSAQVTFEPHTDVPAWGRLVLYHPSDEALARRAATRFGFEHGEVVEVDVAVPERTSVVPRRAPAVAVPLLDALPVLLAGPEARLPSWQRPPDTLTVWSRAARLGAACVVAHRVAPVLVRGTDGHVRGIWKALVDGHAEYRALADRLATALAPAGHALVRDDTVPSPQALVEAFVDAVADLCARVGNPDPSGSRPRARLLPWTARWVEALADARDATVPLREEADELVAGVAAWLEGATGDQPERVELRLEPPPADHDPWLLEVALRTEAGALVPAAAVWSGSADEGDPLRLQEALLRGLGRAARVFPPLDEALKGAAVDRLRLDTVEAWQFISEAAPALEGSGVVPVLPDGLEEPALALRVRLDADAAKADGDVEADVEDVRDEAPARYRWELTLDGEPIDRATALELLDEGAPLLSWGGRWLRLDPGVRGHLERLEDGSLALPDALLLGLAGSAPAAAFAPDAGGGSVDVVADGRIGRLVAAIHGAADRPAVPETPAGFVGRLRGYQRRGVAWLAGMADLGLGALLADAMGVGKTPQLIAHLLGRDGDGPHLVVCPTSVVGNWERELGRFAPDLPVTRFHGPERPADLDGVCGVVVTSYGLLRREPDLLAAVDWDVVTLDEAQHVKNPQTAGARAVRRLSSRQTVVLTGTPLENRLVELWSLLDVTNPGLFGSRAQFAREFVVPVERQGDARAAARLRRVVAPFVLRREKDDPEVVADLPDKIERTVACVLTPEQAQLYERAVAEVFEDGALEDASAMERRGRVLALLTALKQICNHPAHYTKEAGAGQPGGPLLTGRSGKLAAAREIVAEAVGAGERVLVFTQFVQMGRLLVRQLVADLGVDVPFLHGQVPSRTRDRMIAAFQHEDGDAPPVLVVSLRAGGTGVNLTAATQVVHYDRWWNPAVEDQATDRAHRIGQHRTVEVHKLVTAGTVEERIAALLERKRELAESVVGAGEAWLTELDDDDLRDLVELSGAAEALDDDEPLALDAVGEGLYEEAS